MRLMSNKATGGGFTIDGSTPLFTASDQGHIEVVKLLLAHDAIDTNKAAGYRATPLIGACFSGHAETGASLTVGDNDNAIRPKN